MFDSLDAIEIQLHVSILSWINLHLNRVRNTGLYSREPEAFRFKLDKLFIGELCCSLFASD
jgi:hypothetical protein